MRVFELASSIPWAIREDALRQILEIAARRNPSVEAIEAELGRELDNTGTHNVEKNGDVAIIKVRGPIMRYGNIFTRVSGATSLDLLNDEFNTALKDDSVKAVLFDIDSPGGEAVGINEFAEKIYRARGIKPIVAYAGGSACSAAYWIASACDKIVADETAVLGSIGVAAVVKDTEERDSKAGIKTIKFVSKKSPNKRPNLNEEEGRKVLQDNIDAIADVFIEKVARNRSRADVELTADAVVNKFGSGGTLVGRNAVEVGMADELGSFEDTIDSLTQSGTTLTTNKENSMKLTDRINTLIGETDKQLAEEGAVTTANAAAVKPAAEKPEGEVKPEAEKDKTEEELTPEQLTAIAVEEALGKAEEEKPNADEGTVDAGKIAEDATVESLTAQVGELTTALETANIELGKLRDGIKLAEKAAKTAKAEALALKATGEAAKLRAAHKLIPAQEAAFVKAYVRAAEDDRENPVEGFNRVNNLLSMYEAKKPNPLTEELLEPDATAVLINDTDGDSDEDEVLKNLDAQAIAYAKEVNARIERGKKAASR